jgi:transposase
MKDTTISVDVAKSVFEIAVSLHPGHVAETHRLPRPRFAPFFASRAPATVVMEACGMAHHWGRELQSQGHRVVLLPPHAVRPYVPRNKTDRTDAKGILEAFRNQAIHPVPVKTVSQQALAALHRLRSRWMATRTSRINTVRGVLREFGVPIPVGSRVVVPAVRAALADADSGLPDSIRPALAEACEEIRDLEARIVSIEREIEAVARETPVVPTLRSIPGIGLLTATALVAVVGDAGRFPSGRHFASFVGLTPRESSTGLRRRLGAISKRGDSYLRMLLIHGARSVLCHAKKAGTHDRLRTWALDREQRRGHNKAAVALANKLARIVWAVWTKGVPYQDDAPAA